MTSSFARTRTARRRARVVISTAAALGATAALAAPAGAVVNGSHVVAVLPATQGLELSGYPAGDTLNVHVIRNTVTIGSATGVTDDTGALAIAGGGPPSPCWTGSTPQILPGDTVTVDDGGAGLDSMIVQNVGATTLGQDPVTKHIVVHGSAIAPGGGEYDPATFAASVQARITITKSLTLFSNGKNSIRAGGGKFDGTISYDAPTLNDPTPTTWTADFPAPGLDAQLALGSKDFEGVFTVGVSEITIGRTPAGASGCPAPAADSVTSFDRSAVNVSNVATPMKISGVAESGATNVSVVLSDTKGNKVTDPTVVPSGGSWSTTALDVSGLVDGTLTATPTFTVTGQPDFVGATLTIAKDTVVPGTPIASPPGGTYTSTKSVTLGDDDATAAIHYTTVGTKPAAASPAFGVTPITVDHSMTVRAIAIDAAGNVSPEASFAYTITAPAPPPGGGAGGGGGVPPSTGGGTTIIQVIPALPIQPVTPGSGVAGNRVTSPARPAVSGLRVSVGSGRALRISMRVGSGANVVRFQVFRAKSGRASGRALVTLSRVATGRTFSGTLRGAALRGLRAGRYVLVAQAGANRSALGAAARASFTLH